MLTYTDHALTVKSEYIYIYIYIYKFVLVSLFNGISAFKDYSMPKPSLSKDNNNNI